MSLSPLVPSEWAILFSILQGRAVRNITPVFLLISVLFEVYTVGRILSGYAGLCTDVYFRNKTLHAPMCCCSHITVKHLI